MLSCCEETKRHKCYSFHPGLLGIRQYGVHMNGYIYDADNELKMWIGRRSPTKPTYPGMLDNIVGKLCHCTRAVMLYWHIGEQD